MRPRPTPAALLALLALAACGRSDRPEERPTRDRAAGVSVKLEGDEGSEETLSLGPGDAKVTSTDGTFIMALVGDTVRMQLSDSLRSAVHDKMDSSLAEKGGVAAALGQSITSLVSGAMGFVLRVPVREIRDIRYEDGQIRFDTKGGNSKFSMGSDAKERQGKARFSEEDGRRFVEAVKRRQQELGANF